VCFAISACVARRILSRVTFQGGNCGGAKSPARRRTVTRIPAVEKCVEGEALAEREITQVAHGDKLRISLVFHFKDTSLYQEDVVFSQHRVFRVFSYHLTQKGPAFKTPLELSLDGSTGEATVRYTNSDGKEKIESERLKLGQDLANGLITTLVKNIQPGSTPMTLSMVAATPKPRLAQVVISQDGEDWLTKLYVTR
jgi:hypothetical protein